LRDKFNICRLKNDKFTSSKKQGKKKQGRRIKIKINSCVYHQIGIVILTNTVTVRNIAGS
jgi:hypothetical protein